MSADEFAAAVGRLLNQVGHWEQGRWSAAAGSGRSRAERMRALVQRLADLAAEAEGGPRHEVPAAGDLTLPDQLRVVADDLLAAALADDLLTAATEAVTETRHLL